MDCWVCKDKGIVRWQTKTESGFYYEHHGRCDCKHGNQWDHLILASLLLDPFDISAIARDNKEYSKKMAGGHRRYEELKNG